MMDDDDDGAGYEVRYIDETIGKGVFSLRHYQEDDIIFEEQPLVSCQFLWNSMYGYKSCDHCLKPLETAEQNVQRLAARSDIQLPYPECCNTTPQHHVKCGQCDIYYCCKDCQEMARRQYHERLCIGQAISTNNHPLIRLQDAWKQIHYPPETACIMLLARMMAMVQQAEDKEGAFMLFMQFCHKTVNQEHEIAHKLLGPQFHDQLELLRQLTSEALYSPEVAEWLTPDGFRSLVALVGTNGQGVGTSPLSVWVNNCDDLQLEDPEREKLNKFIENVYEEVEKESGGFLNNEGSALYTVQSACNHSCNPNVMPSFPNSDNRLVMMAIREIKPGDEICVSYLDDCTLARSRHSRIQRLEENYLFTCHCSRCEEQRDDPDVTSDDTDDEEEEDDAQQQCSH